MAQPPQSSWAHPLDIKKPAYQQYSKKENYEADDNKDNFRPRQTRSPSSSSPNMEYERALPSWRLSSSPSQHRDEVSRDIFADDPVRPTPTIIARPSHYASKGKRRGIVGTLRDAIAGKIEQTFESGSNSRGLSGQEGRYQDVYPPLGQTELYSGTYAPRPTAYTDEHHIDQSMTYREGPPNSYIRSSMSAQAPLMLSIEESDSAGRQSSQYSRQRAHHRRSRRRSSSSFDDSRGGRMGGLRSKAEQLIVSNSSF